MSGYFKGLKCIHCGASRSDQSTKYCAECIKKYRGKDYSQVREIDITPFREENGVLVRYKGGN